MKKNVFAISGLLATVLGLASGPTAWSKPTDPPTENQVQSSGSKEDAQQRSIAIGIDLLKKQLTIKVEIANSEPPVPLDTVTPMIVPAVIDELLRQVGEAWTGNARQPGQPEKAPAALQEMQALQLFKIAESSRAKGDYAKARACYQQVHILTPTSPFGRLAMDRLTEVEERMRETAEEQDVPECEDNPEQTFRDMRQNSIQLGLVEVTY